jgi:hypothetical protein
VAWLVPFFTQDRLKSALHALKSLADAGLGAASVLANLHHRRIIPLMERRLRIFEMDEMADPVALAHSRLLRGRFPQEYAATRARRVVNLKAVKNRNDDLWSFVMLLDGPLVSGLLPFSFILPSGAAATLTFLSFLEEGGCERCAVRSAYAPSPSARTRDAAAGTGAGGA